MNRNIFIGTAVVLVAGTGAWMVTHSQARAEITYRTATAERSDLKKTVSATGNVQPLTTVDIKSRAGGEVKLLAVDVGTVVKPGDLIARIDPTDSLSAFDQAQADLTTANARVTQAKETLAMERETSAASIENAAAGVAAAEARYEQALNTARAQPVLTDAAERQAKATLLAAQQDLRQLKQGGDPQARAEAASGLATAEANLRNAELNVSREQSLVAKGFVAQSAVDAAVTARDVAKAQADAARIRSGTTGNQQVAALASAAARVAQARAALNTAQANRVQIGLRNGDVLNARAALLQARAALETARANAANIAIRGGDILSAKAQIARSKAGLQSAQVQLTSTTIRAPRGGVILQKYVEQGTIITSGQSLSSAGTSIVQIGDLSRVFVNASVDESDVSQIALKQKVKVTLDAFPDRDFEGRVRRIDPRGSTDQNVTTILTQVEIVHPDKGLRPGLNAECEFVVAEKHNALVIPTRAIRNKAGRKFVLVLTPAPAKNAKPVPAAPGAPPAGESGTTAERDVKTGLEAADSVEILDGLKEGDKVVTATIDPNDKGSGPGGGKPGGAGGPGGMPGSGKPGGMGGFGK